MHQSKYNAAYRLTYIDTYFEYELLLHRWHSITETETETLIGKDEITREDNKILYKYHVDDHHSFQAACDNLKFGGKLSVRKSVGDK